MLHRRLLCVDFDGVLHSYTSGWKGISVIPDRPVDGAMEWLLHVCVVFDVAIYSARSRSWRGRRAMRAWLKKNLTDALFSELTPKDKKERARLYQACKVRARFIVNEQLIWPKAKPSAHLTLDDRAIQFEGSFPSIAEIGSFKPWWARVSDDEVD